MILRIPLRTWFFILASFVILFLAYARFEVFHLKTVTHAVVDDTIPHAFENYRIAFFADTHVSLYYPARALSNVVTKVNALAPDLILLGGDYALHSRKNLRSAFRELKRLHARDGVYAVLGNHDHWIDKDVAVHEMERAGITLIDNEGVWISNENARIRIGGVGDLWEDTQNASATTAPTTPDDFVILLSHNPDFVTHLSRDERERVDLLLAGHTHGGQITLFGRFAFVLPIEGGEALRVGEKHIAGTRVIITSGVGVSGVPFRFGARPSIYILTLSSSNTRALLKTVFHLLKNGFFPVFARLKNCLQFSRPSKN